MEKQHADIVFHHAPWSRAAGVRWLLEELGVRYELRVVNFHDPKGVSEDYRRIQPHKKVPAIEHGNVVVTERAAITIYLADAFPQAGLAPAQNDPMRATYLRMLVYCDAVFDPCVTAKARKLEQKGSDYSFGTFEDMLPFVEDHLKKNDFAAGDRFTAADTQLASSLGFTMHQLKVVPALPAFEAYLARVSDRPAHVRAAELDAKLAMSLMPHGA
jgi:glutathione S-transferase